VFLNRGFNFLIADEREDFLPFTPGQILLPENCSNVCFGGTKLNRLFMTGSTSLYAVYVETQGAHIY